MSLFKKVHIIFLIAIYAFASFYLKKFMDISEETNSRSNYFSVKTSKIASSLFFLNKKISISQYYQLKLLTNFSNFSDEKVPLKNTLTEAHITECKGSHSALKIDDINTKIELIYKKYSLLNLQEFYDHATFYKLMELALLFDPENDFIIEFGMHLSKNKEMMQASIDVLKKTYYWHKHWKFPFKAGWLLLYCMKDYEEASKWLKIAADFPESPRFVQNIYEASFIIGKKYHYAIQEVKNNIAKTNSPELKKELLIKLDWFEALSILNNHLSDYLEKKGSMPENIHELVKFAGLNKIPDDPVGSGFIIDHSNKEVISKNDPFSTVKTRAPVEPEKIDVDDLNKSLTTTSIY